MTMKTRRNKFMCIKESWGGGLQGRDHTFGGKQGSKRKVRKRASHTSCFGTQAATTLFLPQGCHPHPNWQESQLSRMNIRGGDSRMPNLYLPRSGSCFSVAPLTHRQRKRLKTGREGQYTSLCSMNINRYREFQKVKMSGVKYLAFQASL